MKDSKEFTITISRGELLDSIAAINFVTHEGMINTPGEGSDYYGHLVALAILNQELSKHLETIREEQ